MYTISSFIQELLYYSKTLSNTLQQINMSSLKDITIYNVFEYAWNGWSQYVSQYANPDAHTMLLGINPGPHGMVQTGVPFGNISTVRHWLQLDPAILQPHILHPTRPVLGMSYTKEEPSGMLLWNTIQHIFKTPERFFSQYTVLNYCPLAFFSHKGENLTPDKIPAQYRFQIEEACTTHLFEYINAYHITRILAIGRYSERKASALLSRMNTKNTKKIQLYYLTHPSPLNPRHKEFHKELYHYVLNK